MNKIRADPFLFLLSFIYYYFQADFVFFTKVD